MDSDGEEEVYTQHAETQFRQILQRIMEASPENQRRKKLFAVKTTDNIRLRPSMVDRACLKSAVISSTPMVNLKNLPFNDDTSGLPSPIDAIEETTKPKKLTPQKLYKSAVVVSVSSSDTLTSGQEGDQLKDVDLPDGSKAKNLDKIVSNLVVSKAVGDSLNTTHKNVQTSENSEYLPNCWSLKRLTRGYLTGAKERQTQTGASLERNVEMATSSSSENEDMLLNCDRKSLLGQLNTSIDTDDSEETNNLPSINCGAPWRGPSVLGEKLKRKGDNLFSLGLMEDDRLDEVSDDDTFLPKPKQKKVFVNKKRITKGRRKSVTTKKSEKTKSIRNDSVTKTLNKNRGTDADWLDKVSDDDSFLPKPKQGKVSVNKKRISTGRRKSVTTKKSEKTKPMKPRHDSVKETLNEKRRSDASRDQGKTKKNNQDVGVDPLSEDENINRRRSLKKLKVMLKNLYGDEVKRSVNDTHNSIDECQKVDSGPRKKENPQKREKATKQIQKVVQKRNKNKSQTGLFEDGEDGYVSEDDEPYQIAIEDPRISLKKGSPKKKTTSSQASKGESMSSPGRSRRKQASPGILQENSYIPDSVFELPQSAAEDSQVPVREESRKKKLQKGKKTSPKRNAKGILQENSYIPNSVFELPQSAADDSQVPVREESQKKKLRKGKKTSPKRNAKGILHESSSIRDSVFESPQSAAEDSQAPVREESPKKKLQKGKKTASLKKDAKGQVSSGILHESSSIRDSVFESPQSAAEDSQAPVREESPKKKLQKGKKTTSPKRNAKEQVLSGSESPPSSELRRSRRTRRPPIKPAAHVVILKSVKACERYLKDSSAAGTVNLTDSASVSKCIANNKKRIRSRAPSSAYTIRTMSPIKEKLDDDLGMLEPATVEASTSGEENKKTKRRVKSGRVEKRRAKKSFRKNIQKSDKNIPNNSGFDDMSDVLNIYSNSEVSTMRWAFCNLPYKPIKNMPGVSVAVMEDVAQGFLKIMPGKMKPRQMVTHHMNFAVIEGKAEVGVEEAMKILNKADAFLVPPGAEYYVKNKKRNEELILYFIKTQKS